MGYDAELSREHSNLGPIRKYFRKKREEGVSNRSINELLQHFIGEASREDSWYSSHLMTSYLSFSKNTMKNRQSSDDKYDNVSKGYVSRRMAYQELIQLVGTEGYKDAQYERMMMLNKSDMEYIMRVVYEMEDGVLDEPLTELGVARELESLEARFQLPLPIDDLLENVNKFSYVQFMNTLLRGITLIECSTDFRTWEQQIIKNHIEKYYEKGKSKE